MHGHSVLDLALQPLQANFALPLVHEAAGPNDRAMLDIAVAGEVNLVGDPILVAVDAARAAGNSPNTVMAAAASIVGPKRVERALACTRALIDLFAGSGLQEGHHVEFDSSAIKLDDGDACAVHRARRRGGRYPPRSDAEGGESAWREVGVPRLPAAPGVALSRDAILAAISTTIAWGPLVRKRISRLTAETLPWYLRLYGVMVGATIPAERHQWGMLAGIPQAERYGSWTMADLCYLAMTGKKPSAEQALPLQMLIGLLISNGPGSISAQGAKGAVSADGPQTPGRVQINKAMVGFLTHTGYSHGGNGFEGMAFLLQQFKGQSLKDPTDPNHGLDLKAMATAFAKNYKAEKAAAKEAGLELRALPGVHHPVFKGKPVNHDPREVFIADFMARRAATTSSTPSTASWRRRLYDVGATPYVFCVNIDAVIAALLLALLWPDYTSGELTERDLETAAFTVFLYGRMIGAAAEIDDHLNRGRNMDTRTPESQVSFVA